MNGITRRHFLGVVGGAAGVCVPLLAGCRRRTEATRQLPPPIIKDLSLDEVPELATFRPALPQSEPTIRVRVARVRKPGTSLRIGAQSQWLRVHRVDGAGRGTALYGPLTVGMESSGWSIVDGHGFRTSIDGRQAVDIALVEDDGSMLSVVEVAASSSSSAASTAPAAVPKEESRQYPGTLRIIARQDQDSSAAGADGPDTPFSFDLINQLPLEMYLPGVLAGELYRTWHPETFAAQCIAARSFACTEIAVFAGKRHYDVTNTAASQMYLGAVSNSRAREAARITRGMVLAYDGLLVSGYYSSCCGGLAAAAPDAIGSNPVNDAVPLRGRSGNDVCTDAPVYQWKLEQPIDLLTRRLVAFGKERQIRELANFSRFEGLEIIATNPHGRPTRMRVLDDRGTAVEMTAENFRRAANYSGQGLNPPDKPLRSSHLRVTVNRDTVVFEGFGFGHGVGLCQYGAESLAKSGKSHREIVLWYYPGAEIVRAYT